MTTIEGLRDRLTVTVPEAGEYLGLGRGAAYAAARRGELPTLRLGQRLVVPVPKLLELVGFDPDQPHDPPKPAA
ncbi:helix-turn-helix domain-containing protein [Nocardioides sp. 31GB23]|uniref:helix-turn-helix domain-containing protein n=1 Tax=Nocardioides sp. 31GB23 TaxID=3156065 RepID=UPI0032B01EAD